MEDKDAGKFFELMMGLAENLGAVISRVGLEMRFQALKNLTIKEVEKAAFTILETRTYTGTMPTIAEILNCHRGNPEDQSMVAAGKVLMAIRRESGHRSVAFDDPVIQAVIVQHYGGWVRLNNELVTSENKWFIKDFTKAYQAYSRSNIEHFGHLPGIFEINNNARGMPWSGEIRYIGIKSVAKMIAETPRDDDMPNNPKLLELLKDIG